MVVTMFAVLSVTLQLQGQSVSPGAGVTFSLPFAFVPQSGRPAPIVMSWVNANATVSVDAIIIAYPGGSPASAVAEFRDWPGVGRSMAASFGESSARALGKQYGVRCSYEGAPLKHDPSRMMMAMRVEVTCPTSAGPFVVRSYVLNVMTLAEQLLVRVDAYPVNAASEDSVADMIWSTVQVAPNQQMTGYSTSVDTASAARAVSGGPGFHMRDYGLIRPAALVGEAVGSVIGAILFGALFTLILLKLHVKPLPAALIAQVIVIALRTLGAEHDGVWEFDWLISPAASLVAFLYLVRWAQKRTEAAAARTAVDPQPASSGHGGTSP